MLACAGCQAQNQQDGLDDRLAQFQFFTACAPVYLAVSYSEQGATMLRLTDNIIATTVHSRLRGARIYTDSANLPAISVRATVVGTAFHVNFQLVRFLYNPLTDTSHGASTWTDYFVGVHGYDAGYILQ